MKQATKNKGATDRMVTANAIEHTIPATQMYSSEAGERWFGELIHSLRTHKVQLETNTASPILQEFYNVMLGDDQMAHYTLSKKLINKQLTTMAVVEYVTTIKKSGRLPIKLAFNKADSKLRVWAVLEDDDEETEDALIMAEAYVNAKLSSANYRISSTRVEASDALSIPPHYEEFI